MATSGISYKSHPAFFKIIDLILLRFSNMKLYIMISECVWRLTMKGQQDKKSKNAVEPIEKIERKGENYPREDHVNPSYPI